MRVLTADISRETDDVTYELNDQQFDQGVDVQVEWIDVNPAPTGVVKLVIKDGDATQWVDIIGLTANMADHSTSVGQVYSGSVILEETSYYGGVLGINYTRGNEITGKLNIYQISRG